MKDRAGVRRAGVTGFAAIVLMVLGMGGCEQSTQPEYVAKITFEPDSAHLEPGESASFSAVPLGPRDQPFPERAERVEWSFLVNPDVVELEGSGTSVTVTALGVGTARIQATLGRGEGAAPIFVRPPGLASIEIQPSPIVLDERTGLQARAILRNAAGEQISPDGHRISWEAENPEVLFIVVNTSVTPFATIRGNVPGSTRLRLVVGPYTIATPVTVRPR
jgi:hypothetical protein